MKQLTKNETKKMLNVKNVKRAVPITKITCQKCGEEKNNFCMGYCSPCWKYMRFSAGNNYQG